MPGSSSKVGKLVDPHFFELQLKNYEQKQLQSFQAQKKVWRRKKELLAKVIERPQQKKLGGSGRTFI